MQSQTIIPLNKIRILPFLLGALIFVALGLLMMYVAVQAKGQVIMMAIYFLVGLAGVLFFGLMAIVLLAKLLKNKAGIIISDDGLTDNTSGVSAGFIPWKDIRKINFSRSGKMVFFVVMVKKPEKYIEREKNILKRFAMRMNNKMSGSPIHILVSFLDTDLNALYYLINDKRFQKQP